ncbi:MAG: PH domain-containing protein [Geodermatophilaceae bacterium]|nr:PH domain-containing protein [Geodermatophilaceae bacterium]
MGYPEGLLATDEKVVKHLHPHWLTLVGPVLILLVVIAAASFGVAAIPEGDAQTWVRLAILLAAAAVLVIFTLVPVLRWATTHYVITSHRVMFRVGVFNRHGKDVAFTRITDVAYRQSLWDRIVKAGTLTIESAGEGPAQVLDNVPNSDRIQQLINHLVEEDSDRRAREAGRHYGQRYGGSGGGSDGGQVDLGREQTQQLRRPD